MISLDLMKSPEVKKAGDRSIYLDHFFYLVLNNFLDKDIGFDTYIMLSICNSYKYVPGYVWFNTCLYFLSFHGTNTMMDFKMWAKHNESNSRTFLMFRFSLPKNVSVLRFFDLFAMRFFCEWNKTAPADSDIFWGSQHRHKSSTTSNHVEPSLLIVISTLFRDF